MEKGIRRRVDALLAAMTRREKASLCAGGGYWRTAAVARLSIRPVVMADGSCGVRREPAKGRLIETRAEPATCFPTPAALACGFDPQLTREIGAAIGREAAALGVDLLLGPGVNIKRSPLCGRNFEYFSEDPAVSGELGAAFLQGVQSAGTGGCVKHYCCNNQENGRLVADSVVDRRALHEIYLEPFRRAIEKGRPRALMSSYNKVNGEYSGESEYLMKTVLRGRFGFEGVAVSDWGAVNDRVKGLRAGLDLEMPGGPGGAEKEILAALESGELAEQELDCCVRRVLALAVQSENSRCTQPAVDFAAHSRLARRAAAECAVLMKNEGALLPLPSGRRFAVIGRFAERARFQGTGSARVQPVERREALEAFSASGARYCYAQGYYPDGSTDEALLEEAARAARETGTAVIFCGLPDLYEIEGCDRAHMRLPDGMLALVDRVRATGVRVAVVLMLGAPVELPFADRVDAILCMYTAGQCAGAAAADLVLGDAQPSGKLAETWPLSADDLPCRRYLTDSRRCEYREGIYVGYRYYGAAGVPVRYPFGHGLHYTEFETTEAALDAATLSEGLLRVSWRVRNRGARPGAQTVFVFTGKRGTGEKSLRAFAKARLAPGEEAAQVAALSLRDFAYFNVKTGGWEVENGDYVVYVGPSLDELAALPVAVRAPHSLAPPPYFSAQEAAALPDEGFYRVLGRRPAPETGPRPYTMNSTLRELRGSAAGRVFAGICAGGVARGAKGAEESTALMLRRAAEEMPLRALCALSRGLLPRSAALWILRLANGKQKRGVRHVAQKK